MEKDITFTKARALVQGLVAVPGSVRVPLTQALGKVLREDLYARVDVPAFDRATMDGYACRRADLKNPLAVIELINAGKVPQKKISKNQCAKVMTGAPIPQGTDCVVPIEQVKNLNPGIIFCGARLKAKNIQYAGTDIKKGALLLARGKALSAQDIGILAATGNFKPLVVGPMRVGVVSTGTELVEPFGKLSKAKIFNSNAYQLYAQAQSLRCKVEYYGIVTDDLKAIMAVINRAKKENDLLLICGGVSTGDYDLVPRALIAENFKIIFHKVKMRPGKPVLFAKSKKCFCFGVPGNPVSAFVAFEVLVKEFILKCQGVVDNKNMMTMRLAKTITRQSNGRLGWVPVAFDKKRSVAVLKYHGSGNLSVLLKTQGLLLFPQGVSRLKRGVKADVRPI